MSKTTTGTYRNGVVTLDENPGLPDETKVIVTLATAEEGKTGSGELTREEMIEMRWQFQCFVPGWNHPSMDVYDQMQAGRRGDDRLSE